MKIADELQPMGGPELAVELRADSADHDRPCLELVLCCVGCAFATGLLKI